MEITTNNSSKPPSSDIVKPKRNVVKVGRRKRKRGGQHGHRKFSRRSFETEQVDEVIEYEFEDKDAKSLKTLDEWFIIQQIELPERMYKVIEHRARKYIDPVTEKTHIAPMPDAIRKGGLLGADVTASIAFMKGCCCHMSYTTIAELFKELMKLNISRGMLCKATGADYWGAYRKYARLFDVRMQYCMAHLIRDIRFLAEHKVRKLSRWGSEPLEWPKRVFDTLHRCDKMTAKGFVRSMERIKAGFLKRMRRPPDHKLAKKLARRFRGKAAENYFRFLTEPTNNGTERQCRLTSSSCRFTSWRCEFTIWLRKVTS